MHPKVSKQLGNIIMMNLAAQKKMCEKLEGAFELITGTMKCCHLSTNGEHGNSSLRSRYKTTLVVLDVISTVWSNREDVKSLFGQILRVTKTRLRLEIG